MSRISSRKRPELNSSHHKGTKNTKRNFGFLLVLLILCGVAAGVEVKSAANQKQVTQYTLAPGEYEKAIEYSRARYVLYFISTAWGLLALAAAIVLGWSARFRGLAERTSGTFAQALIYVPLLFLTLAILNLPIDLAWHHLSLRFGQSVQNWPSWFWDWTKSVLIELAVAIPMVWILYGVIRRSPRRWWFYFWLVSIPIIVVLVFVEPVIIEPLFFKFEPLEKNQPELVAAIEKVVQRGGLTIPRDRMFEMIASTKMKSANAYVTGFGASKRVVVWDTTLSRMTLPQILFVFGHEMGHYVLGHIPKTIVFITIVLMVFLYLGSVGMQWTLARWGSRWKIRGIDDLASLPLLMTFIVFFSFLGSPVFSTYSRHQEHMADIYGLEVIHGIVPDSSQVAAQSFQILGEINLSDPNPSPFIRVWLYDHPPLGERVVFAHEYDPWSKGQPPRFVK